MKKFFLIGFLLMSMLLQGQYQQQRLFPELDGEALLDKVVEDFKADILFFDYGKSRDTMFRNVYGVNDSLSCVYSGHTLYMDPEEDPTVTVYLNGNDNGINTEHTYPQSKGARFGNPKSDMHHLFPSRALVNEERSNFSFGDIDDDSATKWFYKDQTLITKPTDDLDQYSEWKWQVFEPRESHKGNVARAIMYFYTMYKAQADGEDPDFFWDMLPTLCEWHYADPVDSAEFVRTNLIAKWQQYPNPFVLDCSLATRSYCAVVNDACELAVPVKEVATKAQQLNAYYLPSSIAIKVETYASGTVSIFDMNGRKLQMLNVSRPGALMLDASNLQFGSYVVRFVSSVGASSAIVVVSGR